MLILPIADIFVTDLKIVIWFGLIDVDGVEAIAVGESIQGDVHFINRDGDFAIAFVEHADAIREIGYGWTALAAGGWVKVLKASDYLFIALAVDELLVVPATHALAFAVLDAIGLHCYGQKGPD